MHDRHDTEPSPPDQTPTNPDGIPDAERAAADLLSPEAALRLIPRLIAGVEALGRDRLTLTGPPEPPRRASLPPRMGWGWAPLIVALVGAGGLPALVSALRGDEQRRASAALAEQVAGLRASVARLEAQGERTSSQLTELATTVREREAARRERDALVDSYLRQRPRPDVDAAREALAER